MRRRTTSFSHLEEYVTDFLDYVASTPDLIPRDRHDRYLEEACSRRFYSVRSRVDEAARKALDAGHELRIKELRAVIDSATDAERKQWNRQEDGPWADKIDLARLARVAKAHMRNQVTETFRPLPLLVRQRRDLEQLAIASLSKIPYFHPAFESTIDPRSGLVIAGFGKDDYFPRLLAHEIYGVIDGQLRAVRSNEITITVENPAVIAPFAQREMVDAFVAGVNSDVERQIRDFWRGLQQRLPKAVLDLLGARLKKLDDKGKADVLGTLSSLVALSIRELEAHLLTLKEDQYRPVVNSVEFLPKDELASMADSLVNLTSLKRRVTLSHPQTVGGPIDVAVISRGDGFVWIRRKHYFSLELNPTWPTLVSDE